MASLLMIAALLAAVAGSSASVSLCSVSWEDRLHCNGKGFSMPPPGFWPNVTLLDLSHNAITELPTNSFSAFPDLQFLFLDFNSLTKLNFEEFVNHANLTSLHIDDNEIDTLTPPPRGTTLRNLKTIFAINNKISRLGPDLFSFAPNLQMLILKDNPLIVEPGTPVLNHPKLSTLSMTFGGTSLNVVNSSFFSGLPELKVVQLDYSNINSVEGAFVNNKRLKEIFIEGNSINRILPGTFAEEGRLFRLFMRRNPLFRLDVASLNNTMASGGFIYIDKTPLACECGFEALHSWAKARHIAVHASCGSAKHQCPFITESP